MNDTGALALRDIYDKVGSFTVHSNDEADRRSRKLPEEVRCEIMETDRLAAYSPKMTTQAKTEDQREITMPAEGTAL